MNNFRTEKAIWQRANKLGIESQKRNKAVICLETKQIYLSAQDAFNQTGISFKNISSSCLHTKGRQTAGGYHWEFLSNCPIEKCDEVLKERQNDHLKKIRGGNSKKLYQYDIKTGLFLKEYESLTEAQKQLGGRIHTENTTSKGYFWSKVRANNYFDIKE